MSAAELKTQAGEEFKKNNFLGAVDLFTQAIQLSPSDHTLYSNRSAAYEKIQQFDLAISDAEKCISLKPDWFQGYRRKGIALEASGKTEEAKAAYEEGLKVDPTNEALKQNLQALDQG